MKLTATQVAMEEDMKQRQKHTIELLKEMQKTLLKLNDLIELLIHPVITMEEGI